MTESPPPAAPPVLVVDDEAPIRKALADILGDEGIASVVAAGGEEGLELAAAHRPWVVLLDLWMPGLDGLETLTRLRGLDDRTLVVVITGHGDRQTAREAFGRGAYDFLEKPLSLERVLLTVRHALRERDLEERLAGAAAALPAPGAGPAGAPGTVAPATGPTATGLAEARACFEAPDLREARRRFERAFIVARLRRHDGKVGPTAAAIGVERTHLYRKIKQCEIDLGAIRQPDPGATPGLAPGEALADPPGTGTGPGPGATGPAADSPPDGSAGPGRGDPSGADGH